MRLVRTGDDYMATELGAEEARWLSLLPSPHNPHLAPTLWATPVGDGFRMSKAAASRLRAGDLTPRSAPR